MGCFSIRKGKGDAMGIKKELYPSGRRWREIQRAVRERATPPGESRPRCEMQGCRQVHGRLRRNPEGYMVPLWLHTVHIHGAPLMSLDPDDYLCLCPAHHAAYDWGPEAVGMVRHREGYAVTTTDMLVDALAAVGLSIWGMVEEGWYWAYVESENLTGGPEETPARAVAMAV